MSSSWKNRIEDYILLAVASVPLLLISRAYPPPAWPNIAFYTTIIVAIWLINRCFTPPNFPKPRLQTSKPTNPKILLLSENTPLFSEGSQAQRETVEASAEEGNEDGQSEEGKPQDTVSFAASSLFLSCAKGFVSVVGIYHGILALALPSSSSAASNPALTNLCPNPSQLNASLFTWTVSSTLPLFILITSALLRLLAFHQLKENFTFTLAPPNTLVTTGLYTYIRHPSYTFNITLIISHTLLLYRPDGVVACFLPQSLSSSEGAGWWVWPVTWVAWGLFLVVGSVMTSFRVRDEEKMLEREFKEKGKGWEEWTGRTKRFIPWVY